MHSSRIWYIYISTAVTIGGGGRWLVGEKVSAHGDVCPRGCLPKAGVYPGQVSTQEVSAWGCLSRGCLPRGSVSAQAGVSA